MSDLLDVIDLEEAKALLGIRGNTADARYSSWITAISRRLDAACGAVVSRTVTGEAHDGGSREIRLHHPASAFTSVTEYQGTSSTVLTRETIGTAPADGYLAEPHSPDPTLYSGTLIRRSGGVDVPFYFGRRNIAVTYTAGRYATTSVVAPQFRQAALAMFRKWKTLDEASVEQSGGFTVPAARFSIDDLLLEAKGFLWNEWREIPGVG